ncbi:MAG: DNA polymerase/3'-5' exonuclease PolX [Candidatus Omnitrophica bacterium]|nr:DNA polymerase/3'-5' exonuclease PolX [Candidatus Omnitrophota bacterium]
MNNGPIANIFRSIADILEIEGENLFRIRAYRNAADTIENLSEDISKIAERSEITDLPGIGKDLASKIKEFLSTGKISAYEKLRKGIGPVLLDMLNIPGVGPKTAKILYDNLDIKSLKDLERYAKAHRISGLPGIKEKTEENILRGLEFLKKDTGRMRLDTAFAAAEYIISGLKDLPEVIKISSAGSLRRMKETVRDIDILVTSEKPERVMDAFAGLPGTGKIIARGLTKSSILTNGNIQVDLRVVSPESYGAALLYFTGSKEHNIKLREMAVKKGLKINEYGVFNVKTNKKIAANTEKDMYGIFKMAYIEPELRENTGEIEIALKDGLPKLVRLADIKGDFHVHTEASDGVLSISEIAKIARQKKYEYVVITDHSASLKIAGGLSEREMLRQKEKIDAFNKKSRDVKLLAGSEVDILDDGSLDYSDSLLKKLDFVIAAIHTGFHQSKDKLTGRIIKAIRNKYVNLIAHPSGRLIGQRAAYELDYGKIFIAAAETGTAIEINAYPERLDLTDINSRRAKETGVKLAISTDAHAAGHFNNMIYGVSVARRGWLEKKDVINSLPLKEIVKFVAKKRL